MLCAATVTAQFVAGKALRDTLFLTSLDVTALPAMLVATSVVSLLLVVLHGRLATQVGPARLVPALFLASGLLYVIEWAARPLVPGASAIILYLHVSAAGPLLASGFWLIASERFDPHTARRRFGQLAGVGTVGGLISAVAAERTAVWFGAPSILPLLAAWQCLSAVLAHRLAAGTSSASADADSAQPARSGIRVIAQTPYLRNLAALVLLGTTGAALVDYLFKVQAVTAFGRGDQLLRFFALYYAGTSVVTFVLQTSSAHLALERMGLGATASTPSIAVLIGSAVSLVVPGFGSLLITRGGESILRSSLFRAGYELFYTPIPAGEKRAAKSIIDVAFDRLGDGAAGALVRAALLLLPGAHVPAILLAALACSLGAILAASRLNRGYVRSLRNSLARRSRLVGGAETVDDPGWASVWSALRREADVPHMAGPSGPVAESPVDPLMADIANLRSRDRARLIRVLGRDDGIAPELVPHVIPLLAWDAVAEPATFALQKVAEEHVGQFTDALLDPNRDFAVRRRLARAFAVCVSQRAVDALLLAFDDLRFAVRREAARSVVAILERNPLLHVSRERVLAVVLKEVTVGRPVWEGRRLLDDGPGIDSPLDAFVRDRAGESLAHVFTLLSLVLPREPIRLAFRGLQTNDQHLHGTALEYLDSVLPQQIRQRLWPFLDARPASIATRNRQEALVALLRSNQSIEINLEELRQRASLGEPAAL